MRTEAVIADNDRHEISHMNEPRCRLHTQHFRHLRPKIHVRVSPLSAGTYVAIQVNGYKHHENAYDLVVYAWMAQLVRAQVSYACMTVLDG